MTKSDVVDKIAQKTGLTKAATAKAVDGFIEAVREALGQGDKLTLTGFGSFYVESRKGRTGRNPRTGAPITIPASRVVKFRTGKALKDSVK